MTRHARRLAGPVLLTAVFLAMLPAATPRIYASDEAQYYAYLRSVWFDRDVSFENEYRYFHDQGIVSTPGFHETFLERRTKTGLRVNFGTIGSAILWSPFYAVGHAAAGMMGEPQDGYSRPYLISVATGSAVYGFLALLLALAAARTLVPAPTWVVFAAWFGTPLVFYMYVAPPMAHACSAFAAALFIWIWLRVRRRWSAAGCAALGASAALMAMVREQDVLIAVGAMLDFGWTWLHGGRPGTSRQSMLRHSLAAVAAYAVAFLPQALSYLALNGRLGPSELVTRKMTWTAPHAVSVVLSPQHGWLAWTPLVALGIAGLVWLAFRPRARDDDGPEGAVGSGIDAPGERQQVAIGLLTMIAVQIYVAGSVESWTVAGAFGQRRFVALTAVLVIGLAVIAARLRHRHIAVPVAVTVALCVWWNIGLMVQFATRLMDRQRLELRRNAYVNFVVLPGMLPEIAERYFFDRSSFYDRRPPPAASGKTPEP